LFEASVHVLYVCAFNRAVVECAKANKSHVSSNQHAKTLLAVLQTFAHTAGSHAAHTQTQTQTQRVSTARERRRHKERKQQQQQQQQQERQQMTAPTIAGANTHALLQDEAHNARRPSLVRANDLFGDSIIASAHTAEEDDGSDDIEESMDNAGEELSSTHTQGQTHNAQTHTSPAPLTHTHTSRLLTAILDLYIANLESVQPFASAACLQTVISDVWVLAHLHTHRHAPTHGHTQGHTQGRSESVSAQTNRQETAADAAVMRWYEELTYFVGYLSNQRAKYFK
jgi:hypothetical protein